MVALKVCGVTRVDDLRACAELGVDAVVGRVWDVVFHAYDDYDVYLLVYRCELAGPPRPVQVKEVAFFEPARLGEVRILPADAPLVERLRREGAGG